MDGYEVPLLRQSLNLPCFVTGTVVIITDRKWPGDFSHSIGSANESQLPHSASVHEPEN